MINPQKNSQIKANNIRLWVGIVSLIVAWSLFIYKGLLQDLYVILLGAFTLYTLFVYIWKPINQNKKIRESDDE
jgi:general stress protein CsbA